MKIITPTKNWKYWIKTLTHMYNQSALPRKVPPKSNTALANLNTKLQFCQLSLPRCFGCHKGLKSWYFVPHLKATCLWHLTQAALASSDWIFDRQSFSIFCGNIVNCHWIPNYKMDTSIKWKHRGGLCWPEGQTLFRGDLNRVPW